MAKDGQKESGSSKKLEQIAKPVPVIAKKTFIIFQNDYFREIKEGDDVSDVPVRFLPNLATEGVI